MLFLVLTIIVFVVILPLLATLPVAGNDNETIIRNDTLFIEGAYAKEILCQV